VVVAEPQLVWLAVAEPVAIKQEQLLLHLLEQKQ
jgi:hypothetical protein